MLPTYRYVHIVAKDRRILRGRDDPLCRRDWVVTTSCYLTVYHIKKKLFGILIEFGRQAGGGGSRLSLAPTHEMKERRDTSTGWLSSDGSRRGLELQCRSSKASRAYLIMPISTDRSRLSGPESADRCFFQISRISPRAIGAG